MMMMKDERKQKKTLRNFANSRIMKTRKLINEKYDKRERKDKIACDRINKEMKEESETVIK